jgi:hypothetical protein
METEPQGSTVDRKLLALVAVVLGLILVCFCYVVYLLIRNNQTVQPAQPQLAQTEFPLPTFIPTVIPAVLPSPTVVSLPTLAPTAAISIPESTTWRFISINAKDVGTFENVGDPSQRLTAKCIDIRRPVPDKGALYTLDNTGILKMQDGSKKFQRFKLIARQ